MYQWLRALFTGATLAIPHFSSPTSQSPAGLLSQETLQWTESIRVKYNLPGITVGIIASPQYTGDQWRNETHGLGFMDQYGRRIHGDTLFAIASNSKLFAAVSIGLLINNDTRLENGDKLEYSTKIKDILPNWAMVDPYMTDHLDVLDLLSMRSGMPAHDGSYAEEDPSITIARLRHLRPSTEIRQVMQYNNIHYWVIAEIIAHLTDDTYPRYVQHHILDPLDMTATYNHTQAGETGRRSESFVRADLNSTRCAEVWEKEDKLDRSCYGQPFPTSWFSKGDGLFIAGPGGLVASANDMVKWLKELLEPTVLPRWVIVETHKTFIPAFGETVDYDELGQEDYGQGQITYNYRGHEVVHGNIPGFASQVTRLPALGVGFFFGINDNNIGTTVLAAITFRFLDTILGLEPIDWEERLVTQSLRMTPSYSPLPGVPRSMPSIKSLVGQYHDEGYGHFEIIDFDHQAEDDKSYRSDSSQGIDSEAYFNAISKAMSTQTGLSEPVLFSPITKLFGSAYVFTHFDGPLFNVSMVNIKQNKQGELASYLGGISTGVFVEGKGLGMFDNFWSGRHGKRAVEDNVQEQAEVWFSKV